MEGLSAAIGFALTMLCLPCRYDVCHTCGELMSDHYCTLFFSTFPLIRSWSAMLTINLTLCTRATLPEPEKKFNLLISADNLWLHDEHDNLLHTLDTSLSKDGMAFFTTGHYARRPAVETFFRRVEALGFEVEELHYGDKWEGKMEVDLGPGRLREDLDLKKAAVWVYKACRRVERS